MTSSPSYETALIDIRQALIGIEQIITPNRTAYAYALEKQATPGYWTNLIRSVVPVQDTTTGTELWQWNVSVTVVFRVGNITEVPTSVEKVAEEVLFASVYQFTTRQYLQAVTLPNGLPSISPEGVTVNNAEIVTGGVNEQQTLNVVLTLNIPLLLGYSTIS